ncbi:winged helix-turn-helix domain-containing protein, partial [Zoogloea sp.]|uniref:winged helix-turn-helix domain-containing protein n=1 Tax=Zoogloea sp. TaxID=49181 RepID=UPI0035B36F5B
MSIPDYQSLMLPLLTLAADGNEHRFRNAVEQLAARFELSDDERATMLPSGTAPMFDNRVGWAKTYLKQAGLIDATRRGYFRITPRGAQLLDTNPVHIDTSILEKYQEFRAFRSRRSEGNGVLQADLPMTSPPQTATPATPEATPEELFSQAYQRLRSNLEAEVLEQVKAATPAFFERLVIDLLVAMGYGGSRQDAGRAIGRSGDGGIDGIIKEDKL